MIDVKWYYEKISEILSLCCFKKSNYMNSYTCFNYDVVDAQIHSMV